jgi:sarcosine oxidase/sarcosine oxidase subunit beta
MSKGKILVIGGGIAGLSTAWALNRRGFAVEVFEQGALPHPRASSYDEHRIIRHAYGELEGYAYLMPQAFKLWDDIWADIGAKHLDPMAAVYFMREDTGWYAPTIRSLKDMHIHHHEIPLTDIPSLYPMIRTDRLSRVLHTEGAGVLYPIRILTDLVSHLGRNGVKLHADTKVNEIDTDAGTIRTAKGVFTGDAVVVAAGAWVNDLLPALAGIAVPSRQAVMFLSPPETLAAAWAAAPVLLDIGLASGTYALPPRAGTRLKIGDHEFTRKGHPDDDRYGTDEDVARLNIAARLAWTDFDRYTILEKKVCYYTVTHDEGFLVRQQGAKTWLCSACSGHGFKMGPLMGDAIAAAIAGERDPAKLPAWAAGIPA